MAFAARFMKSKSSAPIAPAKGGLQHNVETFDPETHDLDD